MAYLWKKSFSKTCVVKAALHEMCSEGDWVAIDHRHSGHTTFYTFVVRRRPASSKHAKVRLDALSLSIHSPKQGFCEG
jgi:hypothetical protein